MTRGRYSGNGNTLASPWFWEGNGTWIGSEFTESVLNASSGPKAIMFDENTGFRFIDSNSLDWLKVNGAENSVDFGNTTSNPDYLFIGSGRLTCPGRFKLPSVTDAGPMTATAGEERDLVYNESDSKVYVCTVAGDPAQWQALN